MVPRVVGLRLREAEQRLNAAGIHTVIYSETGSWYASARHTPGKPVHRVVVGIEPPAGSEGYDAVSVQVGEALSPSSPRR